MRGRRAFFFFFLSGCNWHSLCCVLKCAIIPWMPKIRDLIDWGHIQGGFGKEEEVTTPPNPPSPKHPSHPKPNQCRALCFGGECVWHRQIQNLCHLVNVKRPLSSCVPAALVSIIMSGDKNRERKGTVLTHGNGKKSSQEWSRGRRSKKIRGDVVRVDNV